MTTIATAQPRIGMSTLGTDGGRSGIGQYVRHLLEAWRASGVDDGLEVLATPRDRAAYGVPQASSTEVPGWAENPFLSLAWHQWALPRACDHHDLDVLFLPAANRRAPARASVPTVGTVHDFSSLHVRGKYDPIRDAYIKKVLPALVRRLDRVITPSAASKRDIVDFAGVPEDRIHVVPNGVDHARFHPHPEGEAQERVRRDLGLDGPYVLYVSRIEHPGKNHVRLIESFDRMKRREKLPHRLVLAGSDWDRADQVRAAAAACSSRDSIVFLGFVPNDVLPALTAAADLVAFPSLYEGFGIPVLEAMASGIPVVASNTSSLPEVGGGAVGYFDPTDVGAMDSAMTRVLTDRDLHARMGDAGLRRAARFSWEATARATMEVIVDCATEGRP